MNPRYHMFLILAAFVSHTAWATAPVWTTVATPVEDGFVSFYVMGDTPYSIKGPEELPEDEQKHYEFLRAEEHHIARHLVGMNKDDKALFGLHLGDIKRGGWPCEEAFFMKTWALLRGAQAPMFIIPGDNEWNDCGRPEEAWQHWREYFHAYDMNWAHEIPVTRADSTTPEKFGFHFRKEGALFIGINLTGMSEKASEKYMSVIQGAVAWMKGALDGQNSPPTHIVLFSHATLRGGAPFGTRKGEGFQYFVSELASWTNAHAIPTLYINGDAHVWDPGAPAFRNTPHLARVTVDEGGSGPPLRVTLTPKPRKFFVLDRGDDRGVTTIGYRSDTLRIIRD